MIRISAGNLQLSVQTLRLDASSLGWSTQIDAMAGRSSCRSCKHCQPAGGLSWCALRHVPLHPELTADLSCHHWTAKAPELPLLHPTHGVGVIPNDSHQLPLVEIN
ncbi:MAG: hypothetical protein EBV59_06190 [Synechococcaceae bacterium WB7_1C_051]|nr:hypothetical protein [Synechococcaceae bacterium WB7_1C_051]